MSVYTKLNLAREKFHQLKLTKTGHNKFAGYYYFELGDFLIPALGVFREVGLCAVVSFKEDLASMQIIDLETNDSFTITSPMGSAALKGCHEVQNIGAVETYQRRYLWVAALEIVEHDALDATTGKEAPEKKTAVIPATFRSSPTMGAMDEIEDAERRTYLEMCASVVIAKVKAGEVGFAYNKIKSEKFDDAEATALWSMLDSKTRSALKKHKEESATQEGVAA
jgi:hypothetical protein